MMGAVARHHQTLVLAGLLALSLSLLLAPKFMAFLAMALSPDSRRAFGGGRQALISLAMEIGLSVLVAPVMMLAQIRALTSILAGRDSGWSAQSREDGGMHFSAAVRRHSADTLMGVALGAAAMCATAHAFLWLSPVILGLCLSIPTAAITARRDLGLKARDAGLFLIPEEIERPALIAHVNDLAARATERRSEPASHLYNGGAAVEALFG